MNEHLKDILSQSDKPIDQKTLMAYLQGELPSAEAQQMEEQLAAGEFEQEALEGLESVRNKSKLDSINAALQRDLQKKIQQKRRKRFPRLQTNEPLIYAVILILLLLMVLAYWVISRTMSPG